MAQVLVIYDISDDRIRSKVATACEDYGLDRLQYSAFCGRLSRNHQEELMVLLGKLLGKGDGHIQLIPIPHSSWKERLEVGKRAG